MSIPLIDENKIPTEGSPSFRENASYVWSVIPSVIIGMNATKSEMDGLKLSVDATQNAIQSQSLQISNYLSESKTARDDALSAKSGAEAALNSTISLLEDLDIPGTGGYTIEAVDSMFDDIEARDFLDFNL